MKCASCGLLNYEADVVCRRCQNPLQASPWGSAPSSPPLYPLQQEYGAPTPPQGYNASPPPQGYGTSPPQQGYGTSSPPQQQGYSPYPAVPIYGAPLVPYASAVPNMLGTPAQGAGVWSDGAALVMFKNAQLPDRCVKCNVPVYGRRLTRQLWYVNPLLYILAVSPLIFFIVYLCVRKGAKVDLGVCEEHQAKRRNLMIAGWCLFVVGLSLVISAAVMENILPFLIGLLTWIAAVVVAVIVGQFVKPTKIDDYYVWMKGVCPEYLASLPPAR